MTSTPLLQDGKLYLQLIHSGGAWVVALDAATGKELWKSERKSDGIDECEHSYASIQWWPGGVLISDDVQQNRAFEEFGAGCGARAVYSAAEEQKRCSYGVIVKGV